MSVLIEALYIFDEQRNCILEHIYRARPPKPQDLISRYLSHVAPRPAIIQLSEINPPTTVYTITYSNLLLQCTSSTDTSSLGVLEFLHRIVDIFEDFLGSPLLANKIEDNYEIVAQLLSEACDGGVVCNTEPNALKESVEVSSRLGKLFETVGLPGGSTAPGQPNLAATLKANSAAASGPAIPWRRSNVRHTSNELYVDIVEQLSVIFAPSGRPISARANGSIAFTSKISGIPDLILNLTAPGGTSSAKSSGISRTMQLPVFHPCVRLARWKEHPGELSFIPPDGKFMLAGYEVDLLPSPLNSDQPPSQNERLFLPAIVDLKSGLGQSGTDFEARLTLNNSFPGVPTAKPGPAASRPMSSTTPFSFGSSSSGTSGAPTLDGVVVTIPFPQDARNVTDFRASRGDATFDLSRKVVEWRVPTKDNFSISGTPTLKGTVVGPVTDAETADSLEADEVEDASIDDVKTNTLSGYYDENSISTKSNGTNVRASKKGKQLNAKSTHAPVPRSIAVSFQVKGWLPSGIKVDGLVVDTKKSKGLGEGVKPYKGVKYLTVSRGGIERRL